MKTYKTILADPPWSYNDKRKDHGGADDHYSTMSVEEICNIGTNGGTKGKAFLNLEHWSAEVDDVAFLWLWVTNSFLIDGSATRVAEAWGFKPKQLLTWVKTRREWTQITEIATEDSIAVSPARVTVAPGGESVRGEEVTPEEFADAINEDGLQSGMGWITRGITEHILICTRGKYRELVKAKNRKNTIFAPRSRHSVKPDHQYDIIESICPGPYLELFARKRRDGWDAWGNEI